MPAKLARLGTGLGGRPEEGALSAEPGYDVLDEYRAGGSGSASPGEGTPDRFSQYVRD
ncbi:Hypothetical predicted protein, partial [Pelobates cultripes]